MIAENSIVEKRERILSLDLARGLAVFFMILVHVLETYGNDSTYDTLLGKAVEFLGGAPAAPVFMFLMGFFLACSDARGLRTEVARGVKLMLLGYLLSFLRYTLPEALGITHYGGGFEFSSFIWEVDILQFAGFALILLALIRRYLPWPRTWLLLAVLMTVSAPLLWGVETGLTPVDWFLDLLWGSYEEVWFPVFPWLTFPLLGMVLKSVIELKDGHITVDWRIPAAGAAMLTVGIILTLMDPVYHTGDYYRSGPGAVLWMGGFILLWILLCELVSRRIPDNGLFRLLTFWSRNVTRIYFIQWIFIGWGVALFSYEKESMIVTAALMMAAVLLTHWTTRGWHALMAVKTLKNSRFLK